MIPAPVMTKKVVIEFGNIVWDIPGWVDTTTVKINQMVNEGKTDGIPYGLPGESVSIRHFTDLGSAEEWIDFITELNVTLGRGIISTKISDL